MSILFNISVIQNKHAKVGIFFYLCAYYMNIMDVAIKKSLWNHAGTAGILLGLISTAAMFAGQFASTLGLSAILTRLTGLVLWVAETGCCIYLMFLYMKKFSAACPSADNSATFRMGMATAFLSALVYAAASFANMAYISADLFTEQYQVLMQQIAPMMDSNSKALLEKMIGNMPQITFFSNLIYCFMFGTVVSAVLSRNIPSRDPFADFRPDEQ